MSQYNKTFKTKDLEKYLSYFDFEKMGFGPVTKNYEDTVNEIVKAIDNGCKTDKKYISRVNSFFKYFDDNNCKRIYEEILKKRE